jgi:hypothetical protein
MHMIAVQQIVPASILHGCWLAGVLLPVMTTLDDDSLLAQSPPWSVVSCLARPSRPASARCTPVIELYTTCSFVALAPELQMCGRSDRNPLRFCDTLGKNMYHTHGQCGSPLSLKGIALTRDSTFTSRRYARARVRALSGVKAPRRHPSTCGRGSALRRSAVSPPDGVAACAARSPGCLWWIPTYSRLRHQVSPLRAGPAAGWQHARPQIQAAVRASPGRCTGPSALLC